MQVLHLADVMLDVGAVVGGSAIEIGAAAHEIAELAAKAVADRADLAIALRQALEKGPGILHVADREVVVEVVIEVERLLHVIGVAVAELEAGLLPPEQVRDQADESRFGKLMRVAAHGVVAAPDLHEGDVGGVRGAIGSREASAHLAVTQRYLEGLRPHFLISLEPEQRARVAGKNPLVLRWRNVERLDGADRIGDEPAPLLGVERRITRKQAGGGAEEGVPAAGGRLLP